MEALAKQQKDIFTKIQKLQTNFKKDSLERKTKEYIEARIQTLNTLWSTAVENNNSIEEYKEDYPTHVYFVNKSFEILEQLAEELREQLEAALKDVLQRNKSTGILEQQCKLINKQTELIESLKRTVNTVTKKIDSERSLAFVTQNVKLLEDYWKLIVQNHVELVALGKFRDNYFDKNMFADAEDQYQTTIIKLQDKYALLQPDSSQSTSPSTSRPNIKLPNIDIPKFSGDYLQWKSFRDLFVELIHNNTSLGRTQKLFYLKSNLDGEPYELIKHLQVTTENYETAWDILDKRFNNKRTLVAAQLKTLLGQVPITKESAKAIKGLHDVSNECLLALKNLGVQTENWDALLLYLLTQKLDKESHRLYEQSLTSPRGIQSIQNFLEFLENRFQSLEAMEAKISTIYG